MLSGDVGYVVRDRMERFGVVVSFLALQRSPFGFFTWKLGGRLLFEEASVGVINACQTLSVGISHRMRSVYVPTWLVGKRISTL